MMPWHPGCAHPDNDPENDQFCIFCLRKRGDDFELARNRLRSALGQIAECADWCEECEPTERKLATHVVQPYGVPEFLCDDCAELARESYRKAASKGCGPQPEVEPHEQDEVTSIALRALGLLPATAPCSSLAMNKGEP